MACVVCHIGAIVPKGSPALSIAGVTNVSATKDAYNELNSLGDTAGLLLVPPMTSLTLTVLGGVLSAGGRTNVGTELLNRSKQLV